MTLDDMLAFAQTEQKNAESDVTVAKDDLIAAQSLFDAAQNRLTAATVMVRVVGELITFATLYASLFALKHPIIVPPAPPANPPPIG